MVVRLSVRISTVEPANFRRKACTTRTVVCSSRLLLLRFASALVQKPWASSEPSQPPQPKLLASVVTTWRAFGGRNPLPFHFSSRVAHCSISVRASAYSRTGRFHAVFLFAHAARARFLQNRSWRDQSRAGETAGDIA